LARVFRLRSARGPLIVSSLALLAMPLLPYLTELVDPTRRETVYLAITWLGAPLLAWACTPSARRWTSAWMEDARSAPAANRARRSGPDRLLFIAHGLMWSLIASLSLTPALAAPYVLAFSGLAASRLAALRPRAAEFVAWLGTGTGLEIAACPIPPRASGRSPRWR